MIEEFIKHNLFREGFLAFLDGDPHLSQLKNLRYVHPLDWWRGVSVAEHGIYVLTGGRQIGKTTSIKLFIKHILENKLLTGDQIFYLPCDQIIDHLYLSKMIHLFLEELSAKGLSEFFIAVDEVTYVKDWDRAIKALADEGVFRQGTCIITGSDSVILKEAASRFPGRRGNADRVDFHIHPLSFREYVKLTRPELLVSPEKNIPELFICFDFYQKCGGYLRAINDLHSGGEIRKATYLTFEQWVVGDFLRKNKNEQTIKSILAILYSSMGSQVTYSSLTNKMGVVVKETFLDYVSLLERMDVVFVLQAFDQNTKLGFPKKARKIHFCDPFILDTIELWLLKERLISKREIAPAKVEAIVAADFFRRQPAYYMKAEGEIDVVVVEGDSFTPIEVKWTNQLRPQDLKQISKFKNSVILTKNLEEGLVNDIRSIPLPLFLVTA